MTKVDENMAQAKKMLETIVERDYELQKEVWEWRSKCYILEEENKKLKEEKEFFYKSAKQFREENEKLKKTIKDHQLYEEKLEHRIIELEELLHWE